MERENTYQFKRAFYYEVLNAIEKTAVSFILGPRKCGKTVCMNQLATDDFVLERFDSVRYIDANGDCPTLKDKIALKKNILSDIKNGNSVLYLVDEATHMDFPDTTLQQIRTAYSSSSSRKTRIVFAGSQSKALDYWNKKVFSGFASTIKPDFLSYAEWLTFMNMTDVSAKTYLQYIQGTRDFYCDFVSMQDYLTGCLDETVQSNNNASKSIPGNEYDNLTEEMLLDVLYASMFTLHDSTTYAKFAKSTMLNDRIASLFSEKFDINLDMLSLYAREIVKERYLHLKEMSSADLIDALNFLDDCGLITITPELQTVDQSLYFSGKVAINEEGRTSKEDVFKKNNICIAYPMFYVEIMGDLLGETLTNAMPNKLLGSLVECHVRGLLPNTNCCQYRFANTMEVDYINTTQACAVEITISDKRPKNVHFEIIPNHQNYRKILLTETQKGVWSDIERVPYYQFIFDNSAGKELRFPELYPPARYPHRKIIITPSMYQPKEQIEKAIPKRKKPMSDYDDD